MKPRKTLRAVKHAGNDKIIKREPRLQPENSATPSSATLSTDKAKAQAAGLKAKVRLLAGWVMLVSVTCTLFAVAVLGPVMSAQRPMPSQATVPRLVNHSGNAMDAHRQDEFGRCRRDYRHLQG